MEVVKRYGRYDSSDAGGDSLAGITYEVVH